MPRPNLRHLACALALMFISPMSWPALTDISNTPLINTSTTAKPNIMFILDDSASMKDKDMPDAASLAGVIGRNSAQCNGLAYNPKITYAPPVQADGTTYVNMSFTSAAPDGYNLSNSRSVYSGNTLTISTGSKTITTVGSGSFVEGETVLISKGSNTMTGTVTSASGSSVTVNVTATNGTGSASGWSVGRIYGYNLSLLPGDNYYYLYSGSLKALSWTYSTGGAADLTTAFFKECLTGNNAAGDTVMTKVTVTAASPEAQNFANWYSYYRTRINMMRSAAGRAFQSLNSNYRVGFTAINDNTVTPSTSFINMNDFDLTQRSLFYNSLYSIDATGVTPLRRSLAKVGRYYAKKASGQTHDPMQNSCQRNYSILTTDGYWNDGDGDATKLDGSTQVGQQDGFDERPMYDGSTTTVTTTTTTTTNQRRDVVTPQTLTTSLGAKTVVSSATCLLQPNQTITPGSGTEIQLRTQTASTYYRLTSVRKVVTTNGKVTGDTTSNTTTSIYPYSSTSTANNGAATVNWTASGSASSSCNILAFTTGTSYVRGTAVTTSAPSTITVVNTSTPTVTNNTATVTSGGDSSTLADVAEYYYKTDLRDSSLANCTGNGGADVCANQVPASGRDNANTQHMTTFTVGLGVSGLLTYDKDYLTQTSGDFYDVSKGTGARPDWPAPTSNIAKGDDLWHAAVNGRGQFFSTDDPAMLGSALSGVFNRINEALGSGSAVGSSSRNPTSGVDQSIQASYKSIAWSGEVESSIYLINNITNEVTLSSAWKAQSQLDAMTPSNRAIYYMKTTSTNGVTSRAWRSFTYDNLLADTLNAPFDNFCTQPGGIPSQCGSLNTDQKTLASGANLVNWLRGDRTHEQTNATNPLYRTRDHVLGDIIGSAPVYVGKPSFKYTDAGYSSFVTAQANRKSMVYVGANDGMLHAFSANASSGGGREVWAFVPSMVMSNLYKLASTGYGNNHLYLVDGTPVIGDIKPSGGTWKTILVSGLNAGGKGYFALDVTNPDNPLPLWEFTDADLGLTVGNPVITKRSDGTWVVIFSSGYNNSGVGYLYVVDANTGAQLLKIPTRDSSGALVGSATTPSGLGKINVWVDSNTNNTTQRVYSGDLLGNVWRFDLDNLTAPNKASLQLAKLKVGTTVQPITTKPELSNVRYLGKTYPVVFVGTGRYLGTTDLTDTSTQTIYAIKDPLTNTSWGDVQNNTGMIKQTFTTAEDGLTRSASTNAVDWSTHFGWRLDLPSSGERIAFDPKLEYNILAVASAIPGASICVASGSSWLYYLDAATGSALSNAEGVAGTLYSGKIIVGLTWFQTPDGPRIGLRFGDGSGLTITPPNPPPNPGQLRRASWRELLN